MFFWFVIFVILQRHYCVFTVFLLHDYCVYCRVFTSVFMLVFCVFAEERTLIN